MRRRTRTARPGTAAILLLALAAPWTATAPLCGGETLEREEARALLREAEERFRRGDELARTQAARAREAYAEAALRYERVAREGGIRNGKLFYNLGNAYFRAGDLGRAILSYRRAARYRPGDPNLRQNLAYARRRTRDRIPESERARVLRTLLFWHYDFSPPLRQSLFAGAYLLAWALLLVRLARPRPGLGRGALAAGAVAVALLGSLLWEARAEAVRPPGVIVAEEVVGRKGDGPAYRPSFREPLHAGTEFRQIERRRGWRLVELSDGRRTWLPVAATTLVPYGEAREATSGASG